MIVKRRTARQSRPCRRRHAAASTTSAATDGTVDDERNRRGASARRGRGGGGGGSTDASRFSSVETATAGRTYRSVPTRTETAYRHVPESIPNRTNPQISPVRYGPVRYV